LTGELAHLLPAQGPIGVFIHHNTLHAFQHLRFEEAVLEAAGLFGAEPYLMEEQYQEALRQGRILEEDIDAVVGGEEPDGSVRELRRAMLQPGMRRFDAASVAWRMEEGDLAADVREEELRLLFGVCSARTKAQPAKWREPENRTYEQIHPWLIRLSAAYLDQGLSYWPMPGREEGFYRAVRTLVSQPAAILPRGLEGVAAAFRTQLSRDLDAADVVLAFLGEDVEQWERQLQEELLALPGWAGLFARLESEPSLFPHVAVPCTLLDYLAVRVTLLQGAKVEREEQLGPGCNREAERTARAATLYEAARLAGLRAGIVAGWSAQDWTEFAREVEAFDGFERRRLYHLAYERRHEQVVLQGLASHRRGVQLERGRLRPAAQVFFCIDDREESMRRALEEVDPFVETYGAAGFFGVAVDYRGIDDARGVALCPAVVKPRHAVRELAAREDSHLHEKRRFRRRLLARLMRNATVSSQSLVRGALSTAVLGTLTAVPLVARVLAPRQYGRLRDAMNRAFLPEPRTELLLMREEALFHEAMEGVLLGFSSEEKADRVASVLAPAGLTEQLARLVVLLGHGSTSLNNPHESAYDCGACGGRRGGPNARLFAAMANRPETRRELARRGIHIPDDTWFLGGDHDTCSDAVTLFDEDRVPATHHEALASLRASLETARMANARERARRFDSCPTTVSPARALRHVEERSEHLAQPRQECGHATNAVCVVARRQITRNLFLDRRAFLVSYDPASDSGARHLAGLLGAVIPVCAGINLEYYFSTVDNERYGCGSKLPHNLASLLGVMDGHASDLRTGLPLQMVEIHEAVRILFVIETTPEALESVLTANAALRELADNGWIRIAVMDPETGRIQARRNGGYEPFADKAEALPVVASSVDWYRGQRGHLPLAAIDPAAAGAGRIR
jgi:hypothetical protein